MESPDGYEHLDPEFWAKVEERDGCWVYLSDSLSTPTYRGTSIFIYVTGDHGQKRRMCRHRKCVRPGHFVLGSTFRSLETGEVPAPRKRRVRTQSQFDRWFSQC